MWACKVIAVFMKHNNMQLSSNKQFELSQLHPDVLVRKLLVLSRIKRVNTAATKIQRAVRLVIESGRKKKAEDAKITAASFIQNTLRQYLAQKKLWAENKRKNQLAVLIQKFLRGKLARDLMEFPLMQQRLKQMQARVDRMDEAQKGRAIIPIIFRMKKHAKTMQLKRQAHIKMLMAKEIKRIYNRAKLQINCKPRRASYRPNRFTKEQQPKVNNNTTNSSVSSTNTRNNAKERHSIKGIFLGQEYKYGEKI